MKKIILTAYVVLNILPVLAWPGSSSNGGPGFSGDQGTTTGNSVDTPVDGGIISVTALAIGYGVRQARKKKEDNNTDNGAV